jgi:NAD dependent epimerase/dehydratase
MTGMYDNQNGHGTPGNQNGNGNGNGNGKLPGTPDDFRLEPNLGRFVPEPRVEGRRVLVTGAGGFIGSHLVETLVEGGAKVRAMVRYNARGDRGALEWIDPDVLSEIEVHAGDIRSHESVAQAVEGRELVFHLASQIAVPHSYLDPRTFIETNTIGALNVAQACRANDVERMVHTSSSETYGTAQAVPITEDHPVAAQSPYAASKIGADQLVLSFTRSLDLRATVVRPFNTYGPRQSARSVIPTIISQALQGDVIKLGSLGPRRDFNYVSDTVNGFIHLGTSDRTLGEAVQLGTGRDISIQELVEELSDVMDRKLVVETDEDRIRPVNGEVMRLVASAERATRLTGWKPLVPLRDGLFETVHWVEEHLDRYRVGEHVT